MKKFTVLLIIAIMSACEQQHVENKDIDYLQLSNHFNEMLSTTMEEGLKWNLISIVEKTEEHSIVKLEVDHIESLTMNYLSSNYFNNMKIDGKLIDLRLLNIPSGFASRSSFENNLSPILDLTDAFSSNQKELLEPFLESFYLISDLENSQKIIQDFNDQVIASDLLSEDEKITLIQFSSSANSLSTFIKDDGHSEMYDTILETLGDKAVDENGRSMGGCSVDWRSVWGGAVAGLVYGAYIGITTCAAGGTVVLPFFGTATGALGGGVFGAAGGFVSGALLGVTVNLLLTCGRGIQVPDKKDDELDGKTKASCDKMRKMGYALPLVCYPNFLLPN